MKTKNNAYDWEHLDSKEKCSNCQEEFCEDVWINNKTKRKIFTRVCDPESINKLPKYLRKEIGYE